MDKHARTKDEKFMIALYEAAMASGNIEQSFDRYEIGQRIGLHPKGTDTICTLLLQANFIKKEEEKKVYLTSNGERLIKSLFS